MKSVIIILVFILIIVNTSIQLDLENVQIINSKVRYKARIKLLVFRVIPIIQIKIKKKMLKKLVKIIDNKKIIKSKTVKKIKPKIKKIDLEIDYGLKNIFLNVYLYGLANAVIATMIANTNITDKKYTISTNFNKNYFKASLKLKMEIILREIIFSKNGYTKNKKGGIRL